MSVRPSASASATPTARRVSRRALLGVASLAPFACRGGGSTAGPGARLVTLGGSLTETVCALGALDRLVGVDASSTYPDAVKKLPKVGYHRKFSVEGTVSLRPTLVLLTEDAGPPVALEQLRNAGIARLVVRTAHTVEDARERIVKIGSGLSLEARAKDVLARLDRELVEARALVANTRHWPRVLFIYARGRGALSVAGGRTGPDEMLRLAGAANAVSEFEGFRPMTAENVVKAAPDVLMVTTRGRDGVGGAEAIFALPGVALTPAGRDRRIVAMDDLLLLGFGPRMGEAVKALVKALHPT
jgi:iron complex transport system substrate-binding protein